MSALLKFAHIDKGTPLKHILGHLGLTSLRTVDEEDLPHFAGRYTPRPHPGSLYEKYYGDKKIEGAGGNLTGGLSHNLPIWSDTDEFGANDFFKRENRGAAPKRGGEYDRWDFDSKNQKGWDNLYGADAMRTLRWPDMESTANIYDRMVAANPEQLGDVRVLSGLAKNRDLFRRLYGNDRFMAPDDLKTPEETDQYLSSKGVDKEDSIFKGRLTTGWSEMDQPSYSPFANDVYMPHQDSAALIHELGHGIDWNSSIMGDEYIDPKSTRGTIKRWLRNAYTALGISEEADLPGGLTIRNPLYGPTRLWAETKAWDKGLDSYLEGSAMRGDKWEDIKDNVRKWAISRDPSLHSYADSFAGDMIGDATGAATGLAAYAGARKHLRPRIKNRPSTARFFPGGKPRIKRGLLGLAASLGGFAGGEYASRVGTYGRHYDDEFLDSSWNQPKWHRFRDALGEGMADIFFNKMRDRSRINDSVDDIKQRYEGM